MQVWFTVQDALQFVSGGASEERADAEDATGKPRTRRQPPRWRHTRARAVQWRGEASA